MLINRISEIPLPLRAAEGEGAGGLSGAPGTGAEGEAATGDTGAGGGADSLAGGSPAEGEGEGAVTPPPKDGEPAGEGDGQKTGSLIADGETLTFDQLTLPEGFEISEELQAPLMEVLNDESLSRKDLVEKLIGMQVEANAGLMDQVSQQLQAQWQQILTDWETEARALPELGGENFDATLATITSGLKKIGAKPEFYDALRDTGAGTHPAVIEQLYRLTKPLMETPPASGQPSTAKVGRKSFVYPSMEKQDG